MSHAIKIGVSSCLLGERVRYDGGHKHDPCLTGTLGRYCIFVPVCPEVGCGLAIPREAMRLEGEPAQPRLMTRYSRVDLSEKMRTFCARKVKELEGEDLCGFIFKKNSPSCGLSRVPLYHNEVETKGGRGLFVAAVAEHFPLLPLEEGELDDPRRWENFMERVSSYRRAQAFLRRS